MSSQGKLQGKVAIITGGGSGFGAGIARKFIIEGARVLIFDINEADAKNVASEAPRGSASSIQGDVSSETDWKRALQQVLRDFGSLDVVVNNAGVLHQAGPSTDLDEQEYDRVMRINVKQLFWSSKTVVPYFTDNKIPGLFINISSASGARPRPNLVWYAASKGAVNSVSRSEIEEPVLPQLLCSHLNLDLTYEIRRQRVWLLNGRKTTFALMRSALL